MAPSRGRLFHVSYDLVSYLLRGTLVSNIAAGYNYKVTHVRESVGAVSVLHFIKMTVPPYIN